MFVASWASGKDGVFRMLDTEFVGEVVVLTPRRMVIGDVEEEPPFDPNEVFTVDRGEIVRRESRLEVVVEEGGERAGLVELGGVRREVGNRKLVDRFIREVEEARRRVLAHSLRSGL